MATPTVPVCQRVKVKEAKAQESLSRRGLGSLIAVMGPMELKVRDERGNKRWINERSSPGCLRISALIGPE